MKKKNNVNKNKVIEQDGVSLNQKIINRMEKNKMKILHSSYVLSKTSMMIDSILATPRNLLQIDSPILTEAFEDEKCQKEFKRQQEAVKNMNRDDLPILMYDIFTDFKCNETNIIGLIAKSQKVRENLMKAIQKDNVFKMAESIWVLRVYTTLIVYLVDSSKSFFESAELIDMYKFLSCAATTYAQQVFDIEHFMYEDEEDN